jgi:hypothetical protein
MTSATVELKLIASGAPAVHTVLVGLRELVRQAKTATEAMRLINQALGEVLTVWRCKACDAGPFRGRPDSCDSCGGGELRQGFLCEGCGYHEVRSLETICNSCKEPAGA